MFHHDDVPSGQGGQVDRHSHLVIFFFTVDFQHPKLDMSHLRSGNSNSDNQKAKLSISVFY